uniref:PDZ domain-containing protein n=1 Tax=Alexandrium monilatum TaxID=311494 RepID=A0A7S4RLW1_9DINO
MAQGFCCSRMQGRLGRGASSCLQALTMDDSALGGFDGSCERNSELESLRGRIMADIEAKLSQKEESLWRQGQVEIRKLQTEQQQVTLCISKMQEQQAALNAENKEIRGALLEVTSKFEHVVNEMREVLRAFPQRRVGGHPSPSPSVASTSASEAARDEQHSFEQPSEQGSSMLLGTELSGVWSTERSRRQLQTPVTPTPVPMWHMRGPGEGLTELPCFDAEDLAGTADTGVFCTPPRATPGHEDPSRQLDAAMVAPPPPSSWHLPAVASPAPAVLSLASALPSASQTPVPPPGFKRLHLAEHIEREDGAALSSHAARPELIAVELAKEPGFVTLGMEVKQMDEFSLRIERIDEHGLVGRHNARQDAGHAKVQVGDRIVEANGIRHDPQRMLQECKARQRLALALLREPEDHGAAKAGKARDGLGPADGSEAEPPAGNSEDEAAAAADGTKAGSPALTRLRPEAMPFVPSAQKEAAPPPPGLEGYEAAPQDAEPATAEGRRGQGTCDDQEGVKRALFP